MDGTDVYRYVECSNILCDQLELNTLWDLPIKLPRDSVQQLPIIHHLIPSLYSLTIYSAISLDCETKCSALDVPPLSCMCDNGRPIWRGEAG